MEKDQIRVLLSELLHEYEEEEIGISLFSTVYQNETELCFFYPRDRSRILEILQTLAKESRQHQRLLQRLSGVLGSRINEE